MSYGDSDLFDKGQFQAERARKKSPIDAFKKTIKNASAILDKRFLAGAPIEQLLRARAWFIDQILQEAWQSFDWGTHPTISLIAVGGYGRGELHPHSDIDLLLLTEEEQETLRPSIESFLTLLWDIGLEVGHSVRSLAQCAEAAAADLTIITNLMESRTIAGPIALAKRLQGATATNIMWPGQVFYEGKSAERTARHLKYNDTEYNLEPNVKGSPGGLRDIQTILWIARREFGALNLQAMAEKGFLLTAEYRLLKGAQSFLWRVRYALHMLAGRAEDRLLFDHQRRIAPLLGFSEGEGKLAVERLMQKYYRCVMTVTKLNDLIMQHLEKVILHPNQNSTPSPLNKRFQVCAGYLEVVHPKVFQRSPFALLEVFVLLAQHPEIKGVAADTIRLLRDARHLIDAQFRQDVRNTSLFIELLKSNEGIHRNLRRMHHYGLLGRYLLEFGEVTGQMQHDLFHIYTVDAHTLMLVKFLRHFRRPEMAERFPLAHSLSLKLAKPELIYIAALYHDIGKGRGGDHSSLGAVDAEVFCRRHHLPAWDTRLIVWLVQNHLVMSVTAQRRDLSDPQVIHDFARLVGNQTFLDYLYVLTVADINATNTTLWNSWRASLLRQLHTLTSEALAHGLDHVHDREEQIRHTQDLVLEQLMQSSADLGKAEQLWAQLGDDYFLRHSASDIAWHTAAILQHTDQSPLVLIGEPSQAEYEGATQLFIYAPDQHDFFAVSVAAMDQLNLSIQDARIITSVSQFTLDTYMVLNADGQPIGDDPERIAQIRQGLVRALANPAGYNTLVQRRVPRQLKLFHFPPQVTITTDSARQVTVLELIAPDRPGLLARIGHIFMRFGLSLQNAKIATLGERVEDVFLITNANHQPVTDPALCAELERTIIADLNGQPTASSSAIAF